MTKQDLEKRQVEAEQAVLGSMLIDGDMVREALAFLRDNDFYLRENRMLFQTMRAMFQAGEPIDGLTVASRVLPIEHVNWRDYLVQLYEITPTSANCMEYAKIMRDTSSLIRVWAYAAQIQDAMTLDECRPLIADMLKNLDNTQGVDVWTAEDMVNSFLEFQDPEKSRGTEYIRFGFEKMDRKMYIERGDVVVIGGYPSDGKTALAVLMAYKMADFYRVGFFSLETRQAKIRDRAMASYCRTDFQNIKNRTISDAEWEKIAVSVPSFAKKNLFVFNASGYTPTQIQSVSQAYGLDVVFIDYVQIVQPEYQGGSKAERLAEVSKALHMFAQKTGTLVIEIGQLSRKKKDAAWREPDMHDLKETGQFEYDADLILMLYRPDPDKDRNQEEHRWLKVVKNKEGEWGKWPLFFDGKHQDFQFMATGRDSE